MEANPPVSVPLLDRLGARTRRRARPRASIAVAAAGCAVAAAGALILGIDGGTGRNGFERWPGVAASLVVVVAGVVLQQRFRRGPLAAAATVAIVGGLPPLFAFLTFDASSVFRSGAPWSTEAVLVLSTIGWGLAYVAGPGRGRPGFLGAAAIGAWATLLQLTEKAVDLPFLLIGWFPFGFLTFESRTPGGYDVGSTDEYLIVDDSFGFVDDAPPAPDLPSALTVGLLSLAVGLGYLLLSRRLERDGHGGAAVPVLVAALVALVVAAQVLSGELGSAGGPFLFLVLGLVLAVHGGTSDHRATCWIGAALAGIGLIGLVLEVASSATTVGTLMLLAGAGAVAAAHLAAEQVGEPDEMVLAPPRSRLRRAVTPPEGDATR